MRGRDSGDKLHLVVHAVSFGAADDGDARVAGRWRGGLPVQPGQGGPLGRVNQLHLHHEVLVGLHSSATSSAGQETQA